VEGNSVFLMCFIYLDFSNDFVIQLSYNLTLIKYEICAKYFPAC